MALTYYGFNEKVKEELVRNHYRAKKIRNGYLVTTDNGSWVYLNQEEFKQLKSNNIPETLSKVLIEKGILINENNIDDYAKEYQYKNSFLFNGTSLHIVIPTLRCNIKCVYCHAKAMPMNATGYDMDEKTAKKTVDFIFQSPTKIMTIEFQGGDPLLNFDIVKYIVEYALEVNKEHRKNLKFCLVSNLIAMDDEKLDFIKKHKIGLCTSLDGHELIHNINRAGYDKTVYWIKKCIKEHAINSMVLITKQSLPYYKEIVDQYFDLGLGKIWIKPVNNLGYATDDWNKIGLKADEYVDFFKKMLKHVISKNKERYFAEIYTRILLKKILTKECINFVDLQSPCGASTGQLAYNHNGDIHTCDEGRRFEIFKIGTIEDKYEDVVLSSGAKAVTAASINDNPVCDLCAYKPFCGLCPVCHWAEHGNIISKLPDRRCDILMGMFDHVFEKLLFDEEYKVPFMEWVKREVRN